MPRHAAWPSRHRPAGTPPDPALLGRAARPPRIPLGTLALVHLVRRRFPAGQALTVLAVLLGVGLAGTVGCAATGCLTPQPDALLTPDAPLTAEAP